MVGGTGIARNYQEQLIFIEENDIAEDIVVKANLGYCELFDFKCAGTRTCDAWITNGPITDKG